MFRGLLILLTLYTSFAAFGAGVTSRGVENLANRQSENGGFIAPIETSTVLYNTQILFLYRYLGIIEQKQERIQKLLEQIKYQQSIGLNIYSGGPEQLGIMRSALLAYQSMGLTSQNEFYQKAVEKLQKNQKSSTDFFTTPYELIFGLDQNVKCIRPTSWNWLMKNERKLPWIRVLMYPLLFITMTHGVQETNDWPLDVRKSRCPQPKVSQKKKIQLAEDYLRWFESHVNPDGTIFDYVPTTIPNLMALHHAKTILKGRDSQIDRHISLGLKTLETFQIPVSHGLKQTAGEGSITETAEMIHLLLESYLPVKHPRIQNALKFLIERQNKNGGWGFSSNNMYFPDPDDTGVVLALLTKVHSLSPQIEVAASIEKATKWLITRNNSDGGFGSWELHQDIPLLLRILLKPVSKRGIVLTESIEEGTSRAVYSLAPFKHLSKEHYTSWYKGIQWLLKSQNKDGSFPGTWMVGLQFGTISSINSLATAIGDEKINQKKLFRSIDKALSFVLPLQAEDGSFGDDPSTFETGKPAALATSSPAFTGIIASRLMLFDQTSKHQWSALIHPALKRSAELLIKEMNQDGLWDDKTWTAVTFPKVEYARYSFIQQLEGLRVLLYVSELEKL